MIDLSIEIKGLSKIESLSNRKPIEKAITHALNRSMTAAFTAGSKKIREYYAIKAEDIKKSAKITKATYDKSVVTLRITGKSIPFKYFKPKQTAKGVTIKIRKDKPRSLVKHAFISGYIPIKVKGGKYKLRKFRDWGHGYVFMRKTKKWMPIKVMKTSSVTLPKLFTSKDVMPVIVETVNRVFKKNFWRDYGFYLSKQK